MERGKGEEIVDRIHRCLLAQCKVLYNVGEALSNQTDALITDDWGRAEHQRWGGRGDAELDCGS